MALTEVRFSRNVYLIALSAFFADLGYQIVIGGLSPFFVIVGSTSLVLGHDRGAELWCRIFVVFPGREGCRYVRSKEGRYDRKFVYPPSLFHWISGNLYRSWPSILQWVVGKEFEIDCTANHAGLTQTGRFQKQAFAILHWLDTLGGLRRQKRRGDGNALIYQEHGSIHWESNYGSALLLHLVFLRLLHNSRRTRRSSCDILWKRLWEEI